ncbi:hypothetical protein R9C00_10090 [Flammeovirgaceae bacterium SG7u.111]|nr:hypothetical protein [Flammeovirgaceae bacterium SG7u.132]WPO37802.1 hypothetical protein R9C00_10090 [Flammeovirgaceae bacterium SG7u.111]
MKKGVHSEEDSFHNMDFFEFNLYDSSSTMREKDENLFLMKQIEVAVDEKEYIIDCYKSRVASLDGATTLYFNNELGCLAFYLDSWFTLYLNQNNHNKKIDLKRSAVIEQLIREEEFFSKIN